MTRIALIGLTVFLLALPCSVQAGSMDPALSRLRLVGGRPGCGADPDVGFCPDNVAFERFASEYAVTLAVAPNRTARSLGARGFALTLDVNMTSIQGDSAYWARGTEGSDTSLGYNDAPMGMMVWNRLELRKGLPFGFEVSASAGFAANTSLWTVGAQLQWSLVEGFRTDLGQLPDVALRGGGSTAVGSSQLNMSVYNVDLILSKPFVIEAPWIISPILGLQTLFVRASSGVVDLTPGAEPPADDPPKEDALASCMMLPGHQPPDSMGGQGTTVECTGDGSDFANNAVFNPVLQTRVRLFLGGQLDYDWASLGVMLVFDVTAPELQATRRGAETHAARQVAFNLTLGARY